MLPQPVAHSAVEVRQLSSPPPQTRNRSHCGIAYANRSTLKFNKMKALVPQRQLSTFATEVYGVLQGIRARARARVRVHR